MGKGRGAAAVLGGLALVSLVVFALCYAEAVYSFGGGYFAFLAFVALSGAAVEAAKGRARPRKVVGRVALVGGLLALCAAFAGAALAAQPFTSGVGWELRPVFALLASAGCFVLAYTNLSFDPEIEGEREIAAIEKGEEEIGQSALSKCLTCCTSSLWVLFMVMVSLASVNVIMLTAEHFRYAPEESAMINVDGHWIHTRCTGVGEPVVFFEHGLGGNSLDFSWVQQEVAKSTKTCSYDRAGYGRSVERGPQTRTSDQLPTETKAVLDGLGIEQAIFVGHSFAGFNLRILESRHPELFLGLVLVDMVNPNNTRSCDPDAVYGSPLETIGMYLAESGMLRILEAVGFLNAIAPIGELPADKQGEYLASISRVGYYRTRIDEYLYWGKNCDMVKRLEGEEKAIRVPLSVVVPAKGIHQNDLSFAEEIAELSTDTRGQYVLEEDPEASHASILFAQRFAKRVSAEVKRILSKVREDLAAAP